jgi:TolA-binding protein
MKRMAKHALPLTLIVLLATAGLATAQDNSSFWQQLKNKLEGISPQKKGTTTTAVGGVRGAKDNSGASLYWKGEEKPLTVGEDELASFNDASLAAMNGENAAALAGFQKFLASYPESVLKGDALAAIALLQPAPAAEKPAAPTTEAAETPASLPAPAPAETAPVPAS